MFIADAAKRTTTAARICIVAVITVLIGAGVAWAAPSSSSVMLMVGTSSNTTNGSRLSYNTVASGAYVFVSGGGVGGVTSVRYHVNDAGGTKKPLAVTSQAPFSIGPLKVSSGSGGWHSMLAVIETADGRTTDLFARFKVNAPLGSTDNGGSASEEDDFGGESSGGESSGGEDSESPGNEDGDTNGDNGEDGGEEVLAVTPVATGVKDPGPGAREGGNGWRPRARNGADIAERTWSCEARPGKPCAESVGGEDRDNPASDHSDGRAIDIMLKSSGCPKEGDPVNLLGDEIAKWYQGNADGLGVSYVIWENKIWNAGDSPGAWKSQGKSGCTYAHWDHVHVSFE